MSDAALRESLHRAGYIADEALAAALAKARGQQLIRLQCHEGLDLSRAAKKQTPAAALLAAAEPTVTPAATTGSGGGCCGGGGNSGKAS